MFNLFAPKRRSQSRRSQRPWSQRPKARSFRTTARNQPEFELLEDRALLAVDVTNLFFGYEPTVAVNPTNSNNVVVARGGLRLSTDGGLTFPLFIPPQLPPALAAVTSPNYGFGGDDSLAFDSTGQLFWCYLAARDVDGMGLNLPADDLSVVVQQINPLATTLAAALVGNAVDLTLGNHIDDKSWIAADANAASPNADNLYVIWDRLDGASAVMTLRSVDGGTNWTNQTTLSGAGEGFVWPAEVAVAQNGDVWTAWHTHTAETAGNTGEIRMRRSIDGGANYQPVLANLPFPAGTADINDNSGPTPAGGSGNPRVPGNLSWLQGSVQPRILPDPARPGNIYVVSVDDPDNNYANGDSSNVVFARSVDNGANWTRTTISHAPANTLQIMPAAAIDAQGNIAVSWYDTRRGIASLGPDQIAGNADDNLSLDVFVTVSTDGGLTFCITDTRINDVPFDPDAGPPVDRFPGNPTATPPIPANRAYRIGEYFGLVAANGIAYADWTGNTFNGTTPNGQQIYFDTFAIVALVTAASDQIAFEGISQSFNLGSFDDVCGGPWTVDVDWGDGSPHTVFNVASAGALGTRPHTYVDDNPLTGTPFDNFNVIITVTDAMGDSDSDAFVVTVNNVDPLVTDFNAGAPSDDKAAEGMPIAATGSFTDVGILDTHTGVIDWGDGTSGPLQIVEAAGAGTFTSAPHVYQSGGIYTVKVTLTDDDTGVAIAFDTVFITGAGIHLVDGKRVLQVVGTNDEDNVIIDEPGSGKVNVYAAFLPGLTHRRSFNRSDVDYVEVVLCAGDDKGTVSGWVTVPSIVDGGEGNDRLIGGRGGIVLIGGPGDDFLGGSTERSILIGGDGQDELVGRVDDDILIGGRTQYDSGLDEDKLANDAGLIGLLLEWKRMVPAAARKANIEAGVDGYYLRLGETVLDDNGAKDLLTGSTGVDWFFAFGGDEVKDYHDGFDLLSGTVSAKRAVLTAGARPTARTTFKS